MTTFNGLFPVLYLSISSLRRQFIHLFVYLPSQKKGHCAYVTTGLIGNRKGVESCVSGCVCAAYLTLSTCVDGVYNITPPLFLSLFLYLQPSQQ